MIIDKFTCFKCSCGSRKGWRGW